LSKAKIKAGLIVGPDTKSLIFGEDFLLTNTEVERKTWIAFKRFVTKFLENSKDPYYVTTVVNMLEKFKILGT
jgi:hypothetical protein